MKCGLLALLSAVILLNACRKDPAPSATLPRPLESGSVSRPLPADHQPTPRVEPSLGVSWEDPAGWQRVLPSNPMRKATYRIPKSPGDPEDGELAVFYFGPGQGGSVEANVQRWIGQFQGLAPDRVKRADRSAHGLRQHIVEVESGTFSSGMPGGPTQPKNGYGLLGGIVEAPSGPYFFKLTGPERTVKATRETFLKLLDSVKASSS